MSFSTTTDYMVMANWEKGKGWNDPQILPYQKILLAPSCTVFHYAFCCFEGLKGYKNPSGEVFLFRPMENMKRFGLSCGRICLPIIDPEELYKVIFKLISMEKRWIPVGKGFSLYIRPFMISTDDTISLRAPEKAMFCCILAPVGAYFTKNVRLLVNLSYIRAAIGGTGGYKIGSNYAPAILPTVEAKKRGYTEMLWVDKQTMNIQEVGSMNFFVYWTNEKGEKEVITAPLAIGTVLPGITRDSVISFLKDWNINIQEKTYTIMDLEKAAKENRIIESFGTGTAVIMVPVEVIHYNGVDYKIPVPKDGLAKKLRDFLLKVQMGEVDHPFSVKVK